MTAPLEKEFKFYIEHQDDLVAQYDGKFIVIKEGVVLGAYDDELAAITDTRKSQEIGTVLVQKVSPGSEEYSQTFHSRVIFS